MCLKEKVIDFFKNIKSSDIPEIMSLIHSNFIINNFFHIPYTNNEIKVLNMDDILYIKKVKEDYQIVTRTESYIYSNTYCDILEYIEENNENFKKVDTKTIVNLVQTRYYDSMYNKIYFSETLDVLCNGTAINRIIKKHLGSKKDIFKAETIGSAANYRFHSIKK